MAYSERIGSSISPRVIQRLKSVSWLLSFAVHSPCHPQNQAKLRTPTASEIVEMNRELDALKTNLGNYCLFPMYTCACIVYSDCACHELSLFISETLYIIVNLCNI